MGFMTTKKMLLAATVLGVVALVVGSFYLFNSKGEAYNNSSQIAFNHKAHMDIGVECQTCHWYYEEYPVAGLPKLETCMDCHEEPITTHPEAEKIKRYYQKGQKPNWTRIYKVPDHVVFSHKRHVKLGGLDCQDCHGEVAQMVKLTKVIDPSMDNCIVCHENRQAETDCMACHK